MSYASDLKRELCNLEVESNDVKFELMSLIIFKGELSLTNRKMNLFFKTTSLALSRHIITILKQLYNAPFEIVSKKQNKLDYKDIYYISVEDSEAILKDLGFLEKVSYFNLADYEPEFNTEEEMIAFMRGAFIAHGSINNPETNNYHLEIVCPNEVQYHILENILKGIEIKSLHISRDKGEVLYLKKAENIGDFLRYVGASNMLFAYEDLRIKKDLNNYVNRISNCDVANEQKALLTAQKQLDNIEIVLNNYSIDKIDERLLGVIRLRNNNPDDSLSELSEKSEQEIGYYISKSGLSHRFKEIEKMANDIKEEQSND